jgi:hypothetical protein
MKRIHLLLFVCMAFSAIAGAQPINNATAASNKIRLTNGQKMTVESITEIEASLTMGMQLTSNTSSVNTLEVKNSTNDTYIISNTLTKLKVNTDMMGQLNNYDSESKTGNNDDMSKLFSDKLNKPVDITVNNRTGMAVTQNKKQNQADVDETNATADLMKIFSDNATDDAVVSGAFEIVPTGKSVGDSWADTTKGKDMKTIRTYTLKSVNGNEALIRSNVVSTAVNKLNFQEMEFEVKSETRTNGEIVTDISTGLVKKRTSVADITGSIQMMGQDMPISAKATTTNIYR